MGVFSCWIATLILIMGSFLSVHFFTVKEFKFNSIIDPLYTGLHRIAFTIGLALLFILCEYGYGGICDFYTETWKFFRNIYFIFVAGIVAMFLKFKYFQIYSKLTYSIYLVQVLYLYIYFSNRNAIVNYSQFSVVSCHQKHIFIFNVIVNLLFFQFNHYISIHVGVVAIAVVLNLLVEQPFCHLTRMITTARNNKGM